MITTAVPILDETSTMLNEPSTITTTARIRAFNRAVRHVLHNYKWAWARKSFTVPVVAGDQEYDLTSELDDYDISHGIYEVWNGSVKIDPVSYDQKSTQVGQLFYLTPDNKSVGFTQEITGTENYTLWYYATHKNVTASGDTLSVSIADDVVAAVATYLKAIVHGMKRQRNDERNALIDFEKIIDELRPQELSNKAKDLPKVVAHPLGYSGYRRNYEY
jgi:hypothetical protein